MFLSFLNVFVCPLKDIFFLTIVYIKDKINNNVVILKEYLKNKQDNN